ncbi:capsular polysaccharide transport system permease protein [Vreelandella songnenensis]|uniref:Capsular polysaccharide transport system permease protein n=1 Tax=Vreelandella songnenensis TaxID=1176243 RepID=A0A2T0V834_9GAMM|nr:chain-length determining protein [Halomonas songnenensis]PRY66340.1 capsular polysaccharide transport system permease protein [Halomonas songnenensis]
MQGSITRFVKRSPQWAVALIAILLVSFYWFVWAQERYVSRATVVLESPQVATPELSLSSLMGGGAGNTADLLLLREHLLSVDMLRLLDKQLGLRQHYNEHGDFFAKLRNANVPIEELHKYYLRRVEVELDEYAGVLNIQVQAYTPEFAHEMTSLLLQAGENHMNEMGHRLADEQVHFLERQMVRLDERFTETRQALLEYQNEYGLVSPTDTVASINQVVATLEADLARLQAQRSALSSFQSQQSPELRQVERNISALRDQIVEQRDRIAQASGDSLNSVSAEYETLELQAQFAQETYSSALAALENTRLEAARQLKQVSVLQSPLMPEYPTEPNRLYNSTVFAIITIFLAFILSMIIMIIKDHRD